MHIFTNKKSVYAQSRWFTIQSALAVLMMLSAGTIASAAETAGSPEAQLGWEMAIHERTFQNFTVFESIDNSVDRRQGLPLDIGFNLAFNCECECFGHIQASADERAPDGYAVRHHVEEWDRKLARRQPDQYAGAELAGHANACLNAMSEGAVIRTP